MGFPYLVFMIALGAVLPADFPRQLLLILVIGLFGWPHDRADRAGAGADAKERNFVKAAAHARGGGRGTCSRAELLPNLWAPIIVVAT